MDANRETSETWNKVASLYHDMFMDLDLYNESYDHVCKTLVKQKAKVLDIGCGPGNITKYLLSKRPDFDIYGIDIASNMIALAEKNNPAASFSVMDCRRISELTTSFDVIICGFCLPYLSQTEAGKLIADASGLLTDDGIIYLSFVAGDPNESGFQVASTGDRTYFYYHTLDEIKIQLAANEFEHPELFQVEYKNARSKVELHSILIARRKPVA